MVSTSLGCYIVCIQQMLVLIVIIAIIIVKIHKHIALYAELKGENFLSH